MPSAQLRQLESAGVISFAIAEENKRQQIKPLRGFLIQALRFVSPLGEAQDWHPGAIARVSFDQAFTGSIERDRKLTRFLIRHAHPSPLEMLRLAFVVRAPKFVMSQISRHRTIVSNSTSTRYKDTRRLDGVSFYVPPAEMAGMAAPDIKQGRVLPQTPPAREQAAAAARLLEEFYTELGHRCAQLRQLGIAQEVIRQLSPRTSFSTKVLFVDWWNFSHFVAIRSENHAELECQLVAEAMYRLAKQALPLTGYLVECRKTALAAASNHHIEEYSDVVT